MPGPLSGVRVIDFSRVLAGPHCAKILSDLGAEVIKIEPPRGDLARQAFPKAGSISGYYAQQNAGKKNLSIDLNVKGASEIVLKLCDTADVIVENFRPGTLASFGLDYDTIAARNPGIVYASISGYGQAGPWAGRMAYAPTVQAEVGLTALSNRHFDSDDLHSDSLSHADVYSGLHAAIAILAALQARSVTGLGERIDVAMAAVMLSTNERAHLDFTDVDLGAERPVLGATDTPFFEGPDGSTFVSPMSLVGSMSFPFYVGAMRRPELLDDPRFTTPALRLEHLEELHDLIQTWIWTFADMASLDAQLDEAKIATGTLRSAIELGESDWAEYWTATRNVSDRQGGEIVVPGDPWKFRNSSIESADHDFLDPAFQGEHNEEIIRSLNLEAAELEWVLGSGALIAPEAL